MPNVRSRVVAATKKVVKKNKRIHKLARKVKHRIIPGSRDRAEIYEYEKFYPTAAALAQQKLEKLDGPLISIVVPTYNTDPTFLKQCIDSVLAQSYSNWQLCIADDASPKKQVAKVLAEYAAKDKRINYMVRSKNGHISEASNTAIELAKGEYVALLDHDDILWPNALYEVAKVIIEQNADFIYTDEDKIDEDNSIHSYPFFKPDWSPEFLESCNYITHFACLRKSIVESVGGFRKGYEGAQDWDLFIRVSEKTNNIYHIPKVLYSWRVHQESTAQDTSAKPYVYEAQRNLLEDHVQRLGKRGQVKSGLIWQHSVIEYEIAEQPKVAIVVYGSGAEFERSLDASGYNNIELITIPQTRQLYKDLNNAVAKTDAPYIFFAPASAAITSENWLKRLLADGLKPGVGVVGGRHIDPASQTLISGGIGIGIEGYFGNLLQGCLLEDNHYMRALHGKSRRNVAAIAPPLLVRRAAFQQVGGFDQSSRPYLFIDLCLKLLDISFRTVYNPYVDVVKPIEPALKKIDQKAFAAHWPNFVANDPYVNPNYDKRNGRLEVHRT